MSHTTKADLREEVNRLRGHISELERQLLHSSDVTRPTFGNAAKEQSANEGLRIEATKRLKAEQALADREELYRSAIDTADAVAYHFNFDSNSYDHIDEGIERLIGYQAAEVTPAVWKAIGRQSIYRGEAKGLSRAEADRKYRSGELRLWKAEYQCTSADGREVWLADSSVPVRNGGGRVIGSLGILQDITERKLSEEALRRSEEQLRSLLEQNPDGVGVVVNGRFVFTNTRLGELTGYDHHAMVGCPPTDFLVPADHERALCCMGDVMAGKPTVPLEVLFNHKNGETVPVEVLSRHFQFLGSSALLCVIRDITKRKQAEEALRQSEADFQLIANNVPALFAYVGADGCYRFANRHYVDRLGISAAEIVGKHYRQILPDVIIEEIKGYIERALSGERVEFEVELPHDRGGTHWVNALYVPDVIDEEKVRGFFFLATDITDRKQAEIVLRESEARYRRLAELMPAAMYACDAEGRITYFNELAATFWGGKPKIGDTDKRFCGSFHMYRTDGSLLSHNNAPMSVAVNQGHTFRNQEVVIERPDGSRINVLANIEPIVDAFGNRAGAINVFFDVTELRQAQELLRKSQERLDLAIRGASDGLWDWNIETGEEYWSPRFKELLGYGEDEIEATFDQFLACLHPEEKADVLEAVRLHLEENQSYDCEFRMQMKCGEYRWFQSRGEALRDKNGKPYRMAGSIRDITDRKQAEEELRQRRDELAHVSRVSTMGEMGTGIAHELNQPLTAIATYSHVVLRMLDNPEAERKEMRRLLLELENQALRAGDIVRRLRSFVKKSPSNRVPADFNSLVKDVVRFVDPDIRQAKVLLQLQLDAACPGTLVDVIQIQQVLVNLIRNAIDAMDETPMDLRTVTVATRLREEGLLEVSVCDAGKGLNEEEISHVFDAFYSTKQQGMGMGLAISRSIIEDHGGKLWAEANPSAGATFRFTISPGESSAGLNR